MNTQQWQGTIWNGIPTCRIEDTNIYMAAMLACAVEKCLSEMEVAVSGVWHEQTMNGAKWTIYMVAMGRNVAPVCTIFVGSADPAIQLNTEGR